MKEQPPEGGGRAAGRREDEPAGRRQLGFRSIPPVSSVGHSPDGQTAETYRAFARLEAAGRSPVYETLANAVADNDVVLTFLSGLPAPKRQPNLLFAAARMLLDDVPDIRALHDLVQQRTDELTSTMLTRRTQTNEVGRCATLLPALARLPEPLALIEVGASAGLTLLADRYSYDYDGTIVTGSGRGRPILRCRPTGDVPIPQRIPSVAWRAGLDLNPLDVTNEDDVAWLRSLVWPDQHEREQRLMVAIETAREDPPPVTRGDLLDDLPALVDQAPSKSTVVVFHSAVLAYVEMATRYEFAALIRELGVRWLSNEGVRVLPDLDLPPRHDSPFVLVENGSKPLAFTHPHGDWIEWLA